MIFDGLLNFSFDLAIGLDLIDSFFLFILKVFRLNLHFFPSAGVLPDSDNFRDSGFDITHLSLRLRFWIRFYQFVGTVC